MLADALASVKKIVSSQSRRSLRPSLLMNRRSLDAEADKMLSTSTAESDPHTLITVKAEQKTPEKKQMPQSMLD